MIQREEYLEKLRQMSEEELDQELARLQSQLGRQQQLMTRMETLAYQRNELENEAGKLTGKQAGEKAEETTEKQVGEPAKEQVEETAEKQAPDSEGCEEQLREAEHSDLKAGRDAFREEIRQAELSMMNQGIEGANEELDEVWHSGYLYEEALKEKLARIQKMTQTQKPEQVQEPINQTQNPENTQKQEQTQGPAQTQEPMDQAKEQAGTLKPIDQTQKQMGQEEESAQTQNPEPAAPIQKPEQTPESDPEYGTASLEISWEIGEAKNRLREIGEAVEAGEKALAQADRVYGKLKNARGWGIWDILGGGLISGFIKHQRLSEAQEEIEQLQLCLRRFHTELLDVDINGGNIQADPGDFLRFADLFLDGLLFDWMVQNQIEKAARQVEELRIQLRSQLERLKDEKEQTEETLGEHEERLRRQLRGQLHRQNSELSAGDNQ